ncbi:NUDIX hydrolase [Candidatus Shapirobacteria bacterium]|nr:NUDIX hydrolase [Candidatus Shapirobacteria bacterium]
MTKVQKWQELSREIAFQKYSRKVEKVMFKLPGGKETDFYVKRESPAVAVLALTKDNKIILVKQYRPGPKEILFELPGGFIDPSESPEEAIKRELLEETGYKGEIKFVTACLDDAYSTMNRYCFVATGCKKVSEPRITKDEIVELKLLSLKDFRKLLQSGKMTDVEVGYLGLDFLKLL